MAILRPRVALTRQQMLFYCICIKANRFRYSYGRQANRTLRELAIPDLDALPEWVAGTDLNVFDGSRRPTLRSAQAPDDLIARRWRLFRMENLFDLQKGRRLTKAARKRHSGDVPFIGAIDSHNGVAGHVDTELHKGGTITVNYNGAGVAEAFYQPMAFWASDDVNVLYPKFDMTPEMALFVTAIVRREKYRFSYGRKWHLERMRRSEIHLPTDDFGNPDWQFMDEYIKSLPFSSQIGAP